MKQRTKKRCFAIISLSFLLIAAVLFGGCGKSGRLFAGISLEPWEKAAQEGYTPNVGFIVCLGVEKEEQSDIGYQMRGVLTTQWSEETLAVLNRLELVESDFTAPDPPTVGEYFYHVRLNKLPEDQSSAYHFTFYSDFRYLIVREKQDDQPVTTWEVQNPELIKDLFVKYEMYEKIDFDLYS